MDSQRQDNPAEKDPKFGPFKFSDSLLKEMAEYLSKQRRRPVSLEEANETFVQLAYYLKWIIDPKKTNKDGEQ